MNAFARSIAQTAPRVAGRRFNSTLPESFNSKQKTMKQIWLSDPTTYPIMAVVAFATGICFTFATTKLMFSPDVRITPARKNSPVRI
ncbi:Zinc finger, DHHC-type containing [Seminavis robusta]|uniref:Zinc finger, DHHC-type containing n=1 Tax=Seminavis robusta TaxID=568900 RepID=A0A9N8EGM9_9STRA|nr:Zinc finger, DHHC-type containing [Seminavis robusta]|eukprot:Sro1163_g247950.1 Zinc finger, DHHC-type containing (87) ;mRNA; f:12098-12490